MTGTPPLSFSLNSVSVALIRDHGGTPEKAVTKLPILFQFCACEIRLEEESVYGGEEMNGEVEWRGRVGEGHSPAPSPLFPCLILGGPTGGEGPENGKPDPTSKHQWHDEEVPG